METTASNTTTTPLTMPRNAEDALNKLSSSAHATVDSVARAADEAARSATPAIDRVTAMVHHAVETAAVAAAPTASWLTEQGEKLDARQKKLVADSSGYVVGNPLKAVGIAALAGFLLSRILR